MQTSALLFLAIIAWTDASAVARPSAAETERLALERRLVAEERDLERVIARPLAPTHADSLTRARALVQLIEGRLERRARVDSLGVLRAREAVEILERLASVPSGERAGGLEMLASVTTGADVPREIELFRRAIALRALEPGHSDSLLARTHGRLGRLLRFHRDHEGALAEFRASHALLAGLHGDEHPVVAEALAEVGMSLDALGQPDSCRVMLRDALAVFDRLGLPLHPRRLLPLTFSSAMLAEDRAAERLASRHEMLRVAEAGFGEGSLEARAALTNLGVALMDFGDFAGAGRILERALPALEDALGPENASTNTVRQQLAIACFQIGDTSRARKLLVESERIVRRTGQGLLSTALRWQAELCLRQADPAAAAVLAAQAFAADSARRGASTWQLARSLMVRMQALEVLRDTSVLRTSLVRLLAFGEEDKLWRQATLHVLNEWRSRTALALGDTSAAWQWALEAARLSALHTRLQARAVADSRALQLARQGTRFLDLVLRLADRPEQWERAWDHLMGERGAVRSAVLRRRAPVAWRGDSLRSGAHARWAVAQRDLAAFLVEHSGGALAPDDARALHRLQAAAEEAEARLASQGLVVEPDSAAPTLASVRAHLQQAEALVGMHVRWAGTDSASLIAFVTHADDRPVERVVLGRVRALEDALTPWLERLASPPSPSAASARRAEAVTRRAGEQVRALLWDPIASRLAGVEVIHLVPDGPARDLAWAALPMGTDRYLIDDGPELRVLDAERELSARRDPVRAAGSLLALGAPAFGVAGASASGDPASGDSCADRRPEFDALPATRREVDGIAAAWKGERAGDAVVRVGHEANEAEFRALAPGRTVVHLATHGYVTGDVCASGAAGLRGVGGVERVDASSGAKRAAKSTPRATPWMDRRVWLALAGANGPTSASSGRDDGLLTAEEVVTLELAGTEWVVLSACHSAYSAKWSRDGALGMRRAFRLAGARSVIASMWAVADEATLEWMEALYRARGSGHVDAASAVREASRAVLAARRASGRPTQPFHWAAFTATGR